MSPSTTPRRLADIAYGRAGDKGDSANVSIIARSPEDYPLIKALVTAERVQAWLGERAPGRVVRYALDNLCALNFVLYDALDGGATLSTRIDPLAKSLAGGILRMPIE